MYETCKQFIGEVQDLMACAPARPARLDHEYGRNGVEKLLLEEESMTGKRNVAGSDHRARKDCAWRIKGMLDMRYPNDVRERMFLDNVNTHALASQYETFEPQEARRMAEVHRVSLVAQASSLCSAPARGLCHFSLSSNQLVHVDAVFFHAVPDGDPAHA